MQFSDTSTKNGLIQDCETIVFGDDGYTKISSDTNRLATFTRNLNQAYSRATQLAFRFGGRWQYDDTNQTTHPIATTDLASGQKDYELDVAYLKVLRVEAADSSGNFQLLVPVDMREVGVAMTEFEKSNGVPKFYDKLGDSIFLYPAPSYNSTAGLKVYIQREPSFFVSTDTTKAPGVPSIFHKLMSLWASYDYAYPRGLSNAQAIRQEILVQEDTIKEHYASRNKDERNRLRPIRRTYN